MHDIKWIREHPDELDGALARRGLPAEAKRLIEMDRRRRAAVQQVEAALARRNLASKEIGAAKRSNEEATAQSLLAEVAGLKAEDSRPRSRREKNFQGAGESARGNPEIYHCTTFRMAKIPRIMSSAIALGQSPISHSRRDSISISAKRSGRWISRLPQSSLAHVSWC